MGRAFCRHLSITLVALAIGTLSLTVASAQAPRPKTAPQPAAAAGPHGSPAFMATFEKMKVAKPEVQKKHADLLALRYDLDDKPGDAKMTRGKPVQAGPRARLVRGTTWDSLAASSPGEIKEAGIFPAGFLPLPHPNHPEGGMLFPKFHIDEIKKQEAARPDAVRSRLRPARSLAAGVSAADLPDDAARSGRRLEGQAGHDRELLRAVQGHPESEAARRAAAAGHAVPAAAVQRDRRSPQRCRPSRGVTCFDCHVNGHTNAATHLVGDIRPQELRHRIDTPTPARREHPAAVRLAAGARRRSRTSPSSSSGPPTSTAIRSPPPKKGVNPLERGSQVHFMAEFQALLDFPPAPKLDLFGKLDPAKASRSRNCAARSCFFGKAQCADCHPAPYYTDNTMHNLKAERFYQADESTATRPSATARSRPSRSAASRTRRPTCTTAAC